MKAPIYLIPPVTSIATGALVLTTMTGALAMAAGGLAAAYGGFAAVEKAHRPVNNIIALSKAKRQGDKNKASEAWKKHTLKLARKRFKLSRSAFGIMGATSVFVASIALLTSDPALPIGLLAGNTVLTSTIAGIGNTIGFVGKLGYKALKTTPEGKKPGSEINQKLKDSSKSMPSPSKPGFDKAAKKSAPAANQNKPDSPAAKPQPKSNFK